MSGRATFGPAGPSLSFKTMGYKKTPQAAEWVSTIGLDSYEYQAGRGISGSDDNRIALGQAAAKLGVRMSIHAPYYISLSSPDPERQAKSVAYIEQTARAARLLGATIMVVHMGAASKERTREEDMANSAATVEMALEQLAQLGLDDIHIGLETMGKLSQLGTVEEVVQMCKLDGRLRPVVDFGHVYTRSLGERFAAEDDYYRVFENIGEQLGDEVARNLHCHFSKIRYTSAGEYKHMDFDEEGFGPPYEGLMKVIVQMGLTPNIICESSTLMAEDALRMKSLYYSLLEEKGAL